MTVPLTTTVLRAVSRRLGFPPRTGELIEGKDRLGLVYSLIGSIALSLLDMAGVAAMVPMMQYVSGLQGSAGALGFIRDALGAPSDRVLVSVLAGLILVAFVLKDVVGYFFRRWQVRSIVPFPFDRRGR